MPVDYYLHLQGQLSREELFGRHLVESSKAKTEAWNAELGKIDPFEVDRRIKSAISDAPLWALCGGPPCQAYSTIGRSRSGGISSKDHRVYLYREYLRILAVHQPPLFILENVKGLLSSKIGSAVIFKQMVADLHHPEHAIGSTVKAAAQYVLYSLVVPPKTRTIDGHPEFDYRDFIIKSENNYAVSRLRNPIILALDDEIAVVKLRVAAQYVLYSLVVPPKTRTIDGHPEFDYRDYIIKSENYGF